MKITITTILTAIFLLFFLNDLRADDSNYKLKKIVIEYVSETYKESKKIVVDINKIDKKNIKSLKKLSQIRYKEYLSSKNEKEIEDGPFITTTKAFIHIEVNKNSIDFPFFELYDGENWINVPANINAEEKDSVTKVFRSIFESYKK